METIRKLRQSSKNPIAALAQGTKEAALLSIHVLTHARIRDKLFTLWKPTAIAVLVLFLVSYVLFLPIRNILFFLGFTDVVELHNAFVEGLVSIIPFASLILQRYFFYENIDHLFKSTLHEVDESYEKTLYDQKTAPVFATTQKAIYRMLKGLCVLVALKVLSFLPVVGVLVFPAAEFHQLYRSYGLWTAFWALLFQNSIVALGLFQISSQFITSVLKVSMSMTREFLEPHFMRTQPDDAAKERFFRKNSDLLLGFVIPFVALSNVPIVGPVTFTIAQSAMAILLVRIAQPNGTLLPPGKTLVSSSDPNLNDAVVASELME